MLNNNTNYNNDDNQYSQNSTSDGYNMNTNQTYGSERSNEYHQPYSSQMGNANTPNSNNPNSSNYTGAGTGYNTSSYMPNWTYGAAPQPPRQRKPKKQHKGAKFAAASLAVVMIAFGSGYLGSSLANSQQPEISATTEGKTAPAPVITTSSSSGTGTDGVVAQVAAATANSVVEITTEGVTTDQFFRQSIVSGAGSGVIISADGYVVTNNHVIADSSKITVTLKDGTQYSATLVGTDKKTDIAVIKVNATGLQPAVFGDSDTLKVGEAAIVIGNPLGQLGGTVTNGIISALDREITVEGESMTLLQTNAAINPGNSGGALFNEKGELVGIVNAKSGGTNVEGLGFAVPVNIAKPVINDLIAYGYVQGRIDLGFSTIDVSDAMTAMMYRLDSMGVYISEVESGSNAAKAGFQSGDRLVSIDGTEITSSDQINALLENHKVGDKVTIVVSRNGQQGTGTLTLEEYKGEGLSI